MTIMTSTMMMMMMMGGFYWFCRVGLSGDSWGQKYDGTHQEHAGCGDVYDQFYNLIFWKLCTDANRVPGV